MDRERIPIPRFGLELSRRARLYRERCLFNAFPCPMARLRATGRKRDPGLVLVLEYRWQCDHVLLLRFQTGPGRHSRLFAQLAYLHSQFDADPKGPICSYRCRAFTTSARDWLAKEKELTAKVPEFSWRFSLGWCPKVIQPTEAKRIATGPGPELRCANQAHNL
jgi:hypothetical protein